MQSDGKNGAAVTSIVKAKSFQFNFGVNPTSTIILESTEGVRFLVDRTSLSALSSVFFNMMSDCKEDGKPLRLAEDQYTLALLFKIVAIGKTELMKTPVATLVKAIKAADKYDMTLVQIKLEHYAITLPLQERKQLCQELDLSSRFLDTMKRLNFYEALSDCKLKASEEDIKLALARRGKADLVHHHQLALETFKTIAAEHRPDNCEHWKCSSNIRFRWNEMLEKLVMSSENFKTSKMVFEEVTTHYQSGINCRVCSAVFKLKFELCNAILSERSKHVKELLLPTTEL